MASFASLSAAPGGPGIQYRPDNTIIFTIARMNPPTPGHLEVISNLIIEAMSKGIPKVYVILSKTKDADENPIFCREKIDALKTMIKILQQQMRTTVDVELICVDEREASPFITLSRIVRSSQFASLPDVNLFLVIGDDRADMGEKISKMFVGKSNVKSVETKILTRSDMTEYKKKRGDELCATVMGDVPPAALSASFVRNVVRDCPSGKFMELYGPYLEPEQIGILYDSLRSGLRLAGGKRRKRRTIRKRRTNKKRKTNRRR